MSSAGRAASSSGCVGRPRGREIGLTGYAVPIQRSSLTGSYAMETAEHREPYESRGSRTDLGAPGGESPPGDSTGKASGPPPMRRPFLIRVRKIRNCGALQLDARSESRAGARSSDALDLSRPHAGPSGIPGTRRAKTVGAGSCVLLVVDLLVSSAATSAAWSSGSSGNVGCGRCATACRERQCRCDEEDASCKRATLPAFRRKMEPR